MGTRITSTALPFDPPAIESFQGQATVRSGFGRYHPLIRGEVDMPIDTIQFDYGGVVADHYSEPYLGLLASELGVDRNAARAFMRAVTTRETLSPRPALEGSVLGGSPQTLPSNYL